MQVTVIDRAAQSRAWGYGNAGVGSYLRTVEIADTCPFCGGPRGEPHFENYHEDGEGYAVSRWANECGHVDLHAACLAEARGRAEALREVDAAALADAIFKAALAPDATPESEAQS